jgi:SH3-like domain-containing protein
MKRCTAERLVLTAALCFATSAASALDFRSVGAHAGIVYDLPQSSAKKLSVVSRGMPLEVVFEQGDWCKVRDGSGKLAWMEKKALDRKRTLVVTIPVAEVRLAAEPEASVLFRVTQNVILELLQNTETGWLEIRHPDGISGYIRSTEVWGE